MENTKKPDLNRSHDLTIEEVKSFPMFAHFSEDQANEVIETVKRFSEIVFYDYFNNNMDKK
ncbi:MAG: hypothetical protein EOO90_18555 [Pedobacter sp.]|nr:MAG: hypothetical protein EOO90_18555 [Pedobacter sp.]